AASLPTKLTLKVQEGDRVSKGQVLGELDVSEQRQQLKEAEDALKAAEANLANARKANQEAAASAAAAEKNVADAKARLENTAPEQFKDAQDALVQAEQARQAANGRLDALKMQDPDALQLQVNQAKSAVDAARSAVEKGKLKSPIKGVVLEVAAKSGSYVQPGIPLITVGDPDHLQVVAKLSEQDINGVKAGQEVEVRWAGAPEQVVKGEVARIAPAVSTPEMGQTETFIKVYITIEKGEINLKPGATVDVVIYRVKPRQSLLVPNEALVGEGEAKAVFVVENGTAKKYAVQTGNSNELYTEIEQGIKEKSKVILEPDEIKDGQKVRITGGGAK
ncbi:MAG TPA: efflux RND transporter periplasmic adaptor subunit, partial [Syntrophomonadaceae bacterium]|nr:efflux RND transporter periplasmic adaptor subunit [Syntrophomonadaceae bacterium]